VSIGDGIAVVGIWMGVALAAFADPVTGTIAAFAAVVATGVIAA
jgi:hypothetical protein